MEDDNHLDTSNTTVFINIDSVTVVRNVSVKTTAKYVGNLSENSKLYNPHTESHWRKTVSM